MIGETAHTFSLFLTSVSRTPGTETMGRILATGLLGAMRMVLEDEIASSTPGAGLAS
jgi:hypothetical protein